MIQISDVRRRVVFRAFGALRLLNRVQAAIEDIEGAIDQGQYGVVAYQGRFVVLACLSIRSLAIDGELDFDESSVSFDFFSGLADDEIAAATLLANEGLDLTPHTAARWVDRLRAYVAQTERLLGYDTALPVLRSPEGAFGLIGLIRRWSRVLEELGLPPLLLTKWIPPGSSVDRGGASER